MNDDFKTYLTEIKKVSGEENYPKAVEEIKHSINPRFTSHLFLTNGFLRSKNKALILDKISKEKFQSNEIVTIRASWANRLNSLPKPPVGISSEVKNIHKFLSIRGNPYSAFDLFKLLQTGKSFFHPESILYYQWQTGWHRGINIQKVFADISNPESNGNLTEIKNESYRLLSYKIGYPKRSGQIKKESVLFNNDWISYVQNDEEEEDDSNTIHQVTDEMADIEDNNNQLDIEIIRNRNIYRLLLFGGPKSLQGNQEAAQELDEIYNKKGDFILSLMEDESVSVNFYPVLLKRLRDRAIKLYIRKIHESKKWSLKLENTITTQRTVYHKEKLSQFPTLETETIEYPIEKVFLLEKFIQNLNPTETSLSDLKQIKAHLGNPQPHEIQLTHFKALALYSGALFLNHLATANVIDPISSSSVKVAVEIGITKAEKHACFKIIDLIADAIKKPKIKKNGYYPLEWAISEISGLLFDIDFMKANDMVVSAALFYKSLNDISKEPDVEPSFIKCTVGGGKVSMKLSSGVPFEFDLKSYNVYKINK